MDLNLFQGLSYQHISTSIVSIVDASEILHVGCILKKPGTLW